MAYADSTDPDQTNSLFSIYNMCHSTKYLWNKHIKQNLGKKEVWNKEFKILGHQIGVQIL